MTEQVERGVYQHPERARQLILFEGLLDKERYGKITPTDIDMMLEHHGKVWVMCEVKIAGKDVPQGQRILFQHFMELVKEANRDGIAFIAEHDVKDVNTDVYLNNCYVRELMTSDNQTWRPPKRKISVKDITDLFMKCYDVPNMTTWNYGG